MKYSFKNDYSEGAHPRILEALTTTNFRQETGYGEDSFSLEATEFIKKTIDAPDADIHFVSGGTQANIISLASMLKPYESIIAAQTAHINVHEAGGIEATGHRINAIESKDGKLYPEMLNDLIALHEDEHMVKPKVVFISNSTEVGTHYTKDELQTLRYFCSDNNLYLYIDGARLGSALAVENSDLGFSDIAQVADMFYIGGTKNGALLGEAIVIINKELKSEFRRHIKQRGGLLAKGRILGLQFRELFRDGLYIELAQHANAMVSKLTNGIRERGYSFLTESLTNQIFPIFPDALIEKLQENYGFYVWDKAGEGTSSIRLVTSWATKEEYVDEFLEDLGKVG